MAVDGVVVGDGIPWLMGPSLGGGRGRGGNPLLATWPWPGCRRPTPVHTRNDLSAVLPAQLQMAGKGTAYPRRRSPVLVQFLCMLHRAKSPWLQDVGHGSASQFLRCDSSHTESSEGAMVTWSSWLRFCLNCPRATWPVPLARARARQMIQR